MHTYFRPVPNNVDVPTLNIHGNADQTVPIETSAELVAKGIADSTYEIIKGAPHGLNISHSKELNDILINFLRP